MGWRKFRGNATVAFKCTSLFSWMLLDLNAMNVTILHLQTPISHYIKLINMKKGHFRAVNVIMRRTL